MVLLMRNQQFIQNIRHLIAKDDLSTAITGLKELLDNAPQLNEVLHQSGRFENIRRQIRLGTVSHSEANLTQNQIRAGLLELVSEIETHRATPVLGDEIERAISIVNSKNVVVGSTITGHDVHIGDKTIHTESETSKRLRLFLLLFVPSLALGIAYLWYRLQPITLTVAIQYQAANPDLAFSKGAVTLYHGGKPDVQTIENEAIFTDIQRGEKVSLHFSAEGFVPVDTVLPAVETLVRLAIRRDSSLARVFGTVRDGQGRVIAGATIRVQDLTAQSLSDGSFSLHLPPEKQRKKQRVEVLVNEKVVWDYTQPVMAHGGIEIQL
jgi:hypothetical protein